MTNDAIINRPVGRINNQGYVVPEFFLSTAFRGEYSGTNLIYAGFARPGSVEGDLVWQIQKLAYDGSNNLLSVTWPTTSKGVVSNDYEFSWTNRATYTYA